MESPSDRSDAPSSLDLAPDLSAIDVPERRRRRLVANRAFGAIKAHHAADRTLMQSLADRLNRMASSAPFLVLHFFWFAGWILWNTGALGLVPFDPFPFGLLTMVVSLEAIFLSIFVLLAQKRESAIAELREELMLQVSLRIEEEMTKTLQLVSGLYTRMGHTIAADAELTDMLQPLDVTRIERELSAQIATAAAVRRGKGGGKPPGKVSRPSGPRPRDGAPPSIPPAPGA